MRVWARPTDCVRIFALRARPIDRAHTPPPAARPRRLMIKNHIHDTTIEDHATPRQIIARLADGEVIR